MTPGINSLINVAAFIGLTIGVLTGPLADRYSNWRAHKNNGVFEPETRLVLLILPFLIIPAGCLMYLTLFLVH